MRRLVVQRITLRIQLTQTRKWIRNLQQRTVHVVAQAPENLFGSRPQVHNTGALVQPLPIARPQDRTTSGRDDTLRPSRDLIDRRFFEVAETFFSLALEIGTDRAAQSLLDPVVRVGERDLQSACQLAADCGFTGAWETY